MKSHSDPLPHPHMVVHCDIRTPRTPARTAEPPSVDHEDVREAYPQSVASGDPTARGVVLWTRIAPRAYEPGSDVVVEVVDTEGRDRRSPRFDDPIYRVRIEENIGPVQDHTVRIDPDGYLSPDREYYYGFLQAGLASPVGRCRTLPSVEADQESLTFVLLACRDYQNGYYGTLAHAARGDADFVVHLGTSSTIRPAGSTRGREVSAIRTVRWSSRAAKGSPTRSPTSGSSVGPATGTGISSRCRNHTSRSGRGTTTPSRTTASGTTDSTRRSSRTTRAATIPTSRSGSPLPATRPGASTLPSESRMTPTPTTSTTSSGSGASSASVISSRFS